MHEWAKAHKNIWMAQEHIHRAQLKMAYRKSRFPRKAKEYEKAYVRCGELIDILEAIKIELRYLINKYGIKQNDKDSKTLKKYLAAPKIISAKEWVEKH